MPTKKQIDLRDLPEHVQQEVYDFYLFIKQRALKKQSIVDAGENALPSEKAWPKTGTNPKKTKHGRRFSRRYCLCPLSFLGFESI